MFNFFNLTPRKIKKAHKVFTWFAIFSLILQLNSGVFLSRQVLAAEESPLPESTSVAALPPVEEIPVELPPVEETPSTPEIPLDLTKPIEPPQSAELVSNEIPKQIEEVCLTDEQIVSSTNEDWEINTGEGW